MYSVTYDGTSNKYIGRCTRYPLASYPADTPNDAMVGIISLMDGYDIDDDVTDVDIIVPDIGRADTDIQTVTNWPPFTAHLIDLDNDEDDDGDDS